MCQDPKIQEKIDRIMEDLLDSTNITKDGAYNFAFLCWQNGYDKIKNNNGWISVEDRLPKNNLERVLVLLKDDTFTIHLGLNKIDTDRCIDGKWVRWSNHVTYWQPLPEPPKGD